MFDDDILTAYIGLLPIVFTIERRVVIIIQSLLNTCLYDARSLILTKATKSSGPIKKTSPLRPHLPYRLVFVQRGERRNADQGST